MTSSVGNKQTEGPGWEFNKTVGACFNDVRAVFLEIFGYMQTYKQTESFIL